MALRLYVEGMIWVKPGELAGRPLLARPIAYIVSAHLPSLHWAGHSDQRDMRSQQAQVVRRSSISELGD